MNTPEINVTPLIDVLLVLLIIFMVISPMKPAQIETKIPQPPNENDPAINHPWTLVVSIRPDYSLDLNNEREYASLLELPKLTSDLETVFKKRLEGMTVADSNEIWVKTVFVKAPKSMSYGKVVEVIDAIKLGGADPVSLQIDGLGG